MNEPIRISDQDLERHQLMLARIHQAQRLQQHAQRLQVRANDLTAAFRIWAEELHERYQLDANAGEGVVEDGTIIRATPRNTVAASAPAPR